MFYGVNLLDLDRRAATFVDKILKGRTPADLPVEQPMKFEFIVSLQAAKKIGLTIPPNVLVRANRVIRLILDPSTSLRTGFGFWIRSPEAKLMSLSGMVEIPRPFDPAQGMLQEKRKSVMPALRLRSG